MSRQSIPVRGDLINFVRSGGTIGYQNLPDHFVERDGFRAGRTFITYERATYFGVPPSQRSLVPDENQLLGATHFEAWLRR